MTSLVLWERAVLVVFGLLVFLAGLDGFDRALRRNSWAWLGGTVVMIAAVGLVYRVVTMP